MPFTVDFLDDGHIPEWDATTDGAVATERDDYTPRFYVAARDPDADIDLTALRSIYDQHPDVVATKMVTRRPGFRRDEEPVLAVDVDHIDRVTSLARQARQLNTYPVGDLAFVTLPSYSPELNPVEECWRQLQAALSNRFFDSLDELTTAIDTALDQLSVPRVSDYF